jgi:hypothetical protein
LASGPLLHLRLMKILLLSPHYDDAPLSLGQSMLNGVLSRHSVTVGVLFAKTNWTQWFHPTRGRWPLVSALRCAEELRTALNFRYRLKLAPFEEAILRTGELNVESYLNQAFEPSTSPELPALARRIENWSRDFDLTISPMGLGFHIDHSLTAAAATSLADRVPIAFYEDRPYASWCTSEEIAAIAQHLGAKLNRRGASPPITELKHGKIWYPSQFDQFFTGTAAADVEQRQVEHLWSAEGGLGEAALDML